MYQIYRRLVELPLGVTRDRLADSLLREQEVGTLRFRDRRWRSPSQDDESKIDDAASGSASEVARRHCQTNWA